MSTLLDVTHDDEPLGNFLSAIVAGLGHEGVPVLAIARSIKHPSNAVRRALHAAFDAGAITEIPRDDWPPGRRRHEREQSEPVATDGEQIITNAVRVFRLTKCEASIFSLLVRRPEATKAQLHTVAHEARDPQSETTDPKIVDVFICHLRKKLKGSGVEIKTLWGRGYCIELPVRKLAYQLLGMEGHADRVTVRQIAPTHADRGVLNSLESAQ